jgi:NitT/TauT family transport system permease protein
LRTDGDLIFEVATDAPVSVEPPRRSLAARLYEQELFRRLIVVAGLIAVWQAAAAWVASDLLLPTPLQTLDAFVEGVKSGTIPARVWTSLQLLAAGYAVGVVLAGVLVALAMASRLGRDLLSTMTAMFNPLPAIALLPLAMIWFGLGAGGLIFVLAHSVLWAVALNTLSGFESVSPTLRMVGRNYGLRGAGYVLKILVPAAFPSVLTGLKVGWAFAWRTLIAAELVFGVSAGSGGLGWYIYETKNQLEIPSVFAGLGTVVLIGLAVEYLVFRRIEARTVRKWGMQA